ncbi:hypothetical protein GLAREA_05535 [Glarea lozoyensis ATCC 20868]|uniref:Uncharacterized protein n=1 Tax=Glarea lozoyensis (strain ATCC 20868 / MF5171) TaxID=1116229 RepID=S3DCR2_GLAL2|nr:uncharacterized protein GLAREA_05535 [Glarea lozoyensis ATCC 20868]EPE36197.1 hypothetical protein GLAREA_05535 [Glarea lozoyensis ATCC 20868]
MPSKKAAVDEKASTELLAKDGLEPHLNSWCSWHKMIQQNVYRTPYSELGRALLDQTPPVNWRVPTLRSSRLDTNTRAERVPHSWLLGNLTKTRKGEDLNGGESHLSSLLHRYQVHVLGLGEICLPRLLDMFLVHQYRIV